MSFVNKPQETFVAPPAVMELEDVNDDFALPSPVISPPGFDVPFGESFTEADDWLQLAFACPTESFDFSAPGPPHANTPATSQATIPELQHDSYTPVGLQTMASEQLQEESNQHSWEEDQSFNLLESRVRVLEQRLQEKQEELKLIQVEHRLDGVLGEVRSTRSELTHLHAALQNLVHLLVDNQDVATPSSHNP